MNSTRTQSRLSSPQTVHVPHAGTHSALSSRFSNYCANSSYSQASPRLEVKVSRLDTEENKPGPAALAELEMAAFSLGRACTKAILTGDTDFLMIGAPQTFSGDEASFPAQYGYDRFQRSDIAHELASNVVSDALDSTEREMHAEEASSSSADGSTPSA